MGLKINTDAVKSQLSDMNQNLDTMASRDNLLQMPLSAPIQSGLRRDFQKNMSNI